MRARHTQALAEIRAVPSKTLVNRTRMKVVNIALTRMMKKFRRHCEPTGRREAPPDDRLREAIQGLQERLDCFIAALLAMTGYDGNTTPHPEERPLWPRLEG
jgi:predicted lipase